MLACIITLVLTVTADVQPQAPKHPPDEANKKFEVLHQKQQTPAMKQYCAKHPAASMCPKG